MKTKFRFLALALLAMGLTFTACSKDDDDTTPEPNPQERPQEPQEPQEPQRELHPLVWSEFFVIGETDTVDVVYEYLDYAAYRSLDNDTTLFSFGVYSAYDETMGDEGYYLPFSESEIYVKGNKVVDGFVLYTQDRSEDVPQWFGAIFTDEGDYIIDELDLTNHVASITYAARLYNARDFAEGGETKEALLGARQALYYATIRDIQFIPEN